MTPALQKTWLTGLLLRALAARPTLRVSEYCEREVVFSEPNCRGPFTFASREYLREPLDWYSSNDTDMVLCFGTRTGKTRVLFGGKAWLLKHEPCRMLCVMPNTHGTGGAQNVARTRFIPMLRATASLADLIPSGARRHEFKSLQQILGGSIIDWAGSNSPANLASNPARYVEQDEVDKYKRQGDREADPSKLADERCKEFSNPKRAKASTPTLISGLIWQELLKTDMRRRFVPCPHCQKLLAFAWSKDFTLLPTVNVGFVCWDKEARRKDGTWDFDRVERSARVECPHCGGHVTDNHKTRMDRDGQWQPTREGTPKMKGFHLPSMYSASVQTRFGNMAIRFLNAKQSIQGLQGFINSDLAEPYEGQENRAKRVAAASGPFVITGEWNKLMTGDCQARAPYFWYVVRAWKGNKSEGLAAGSCDTWEELAAVQVANEVKDVNVSVDSAWGAKSEAEVYLNCARHCEFVKMPETDATVAVGWTPVRGFDGNKRWRDSDSETFQPYGLRAIDPFLGTSDGGQVTIFLFEFASDFFKDILTNLRAGKGDSHWAVGDKMVSEEYWRHMDGQVKRTRANPKTGMIIERWEKRSRYWPDHLFACEYQQVARANFAQWFELTTKD